MVRNGRLIFCDNEHGSGHVCYPDIYDMDAHALCQLFINSQPASALRKAAKKEGWGRVNGGDYCAGCMEST
jgi:hypothetical protein